MQKVKISELDLENSLFHFHPKEFYYEVEGKGLEPRIGNNANGIEKTPKVFFSKGMDGVLKCWDVWIKWEMKHTFNGDNKYNLFETDDELLQMKDYWHDNFPTNANYEEIKLFFHDFPEKSKEKFFDTIIPQKIQNQDYFILEIKDGLEYDSKDIDEAKQALKDAYDIIEPSDYAKKYGAIKITNTARALYGSFSKNDTSMDNWNMHTKSFVGVEKDKIKQVQTIEDQTDALSIILELYDISKKNNTADYFNQFDILNEFVDYVKRSKKKSKNERHKGDENMNNELNNQERTNEEELKELKRERENLELSDLINTEVLPVSEEKKSEMTYEEAEAIYNQEQVQVLGISETKEMEKPKVLLKTKPNNYGFADKLLITLLVGFAGGVIATTAYIFLNLGKFTFTI